MTSVVIGRSGIIDEPMLGRLLLLFTVVPAVELYLLVSLGGVLGGLPTVGLVLVTGLVGAFLAKREGLRVLQDWRSSIARGQLPADGITSGLLVLVGGVLLVTPGVLTDVVGLSLLVPPLRRQVAAVIARRAQRAMTQGTLQVHHLEAVYSDPGGVVRPRDVIDVEARPREPSSH
ncbi:MAG: FxsA family protein [Myxococcales bacterium FL481]|nr:MAG: FxsA family protein [Myxococcales bacterium FL481]